MILPAEGQRTPESPLVAANWMPVKVVAEYDPCCTCLCLYSNSHVNETTFRRARRSVMVASPLMHWRILEPLPTPDTEGHDNKRPRKESAVIGKSDKQCFKSFLPYLSPQFPLCLLMNRMHTHCVHLVTRGPRRWRRS